MTQRTLFPEPPKRKVKKPARYAVMVWSEFLDDWSNNGHVGGFTLWDVKREVQRLENEGWERSLLHVRRIGWSKNDERKAMERDRKFSNERRRYR